VFFPHFRRNYIGNFINLFKNHPLNLPDFFSIYNTHYSPFCVQAKIIKLVGLKNGGCLSPINLVTFAGTQNGEYITYFFIFTQFLPLLFFWENFQFDICFVY
jgi:hypothetical protein